MRDREQYVRPPLVAAEPPSAFVRRWRYRLVVGLLMLVAVLALVWVFLRYSGVTGGEDPGLIGTLAPLMTGASPAP